MTYIVVSNDNKENISTAPALNRSGEVYEWWMVDRQHPEHVIYADTLHDLASVICKNPLDGSPEENMNALIRTGMEAVKTLKAQLKDIIRESNVEVPEWEAEIIVASLEHPYDCVYGWGDGGSSFLVEESPSMNFPNRDIWYSQVPLITFEIHYAPFTSLMPPASGYDDPLLPSNIKQVLVSSEYSLLDSFQVCGLIEFGRTLE